jgi:hypothetical protein
MPNPTRREERDKTALWCRSDGTEGRVGQERKPNVLHVSQLCVYDGTGAGPTPFVGVCWAARGLGLDGCGWLDADEEGHLEPLPVAVDVGEADRAQPVQLGVHVERPIGWVLVLDRLADRRKER